MANGIVEWVLRVTNQASKPTDEAAASARGLTKATKEAAPATSDLGKTSGKAAEGLARLGGALSIISPQAGALVGEASRAAGGLRTLVEGAEAAGVGLGALGAGFAALVGVAAPLIGQLAVMNREQEEAAARIAFTARHAHDLDSSFRGLEDASLKLALATGELTKVQAEQAGIMLDASRSVEDFNAKLEEERTKASNDYITAERRLQQWGAFGEVVKTTADYYLGYTSTMQESKRTVEALDAEESKHTDTVMDTADALTKAAAASGKKATADTSAKSAAGAMADELERQAKACVIISSTGTKFNFSMNGKGGGTTTQRGELTPEQIAQLAARGQDAAGLAWDGPAAVADGFATSLSDADVAVRQMTAASRDASIALALQKGITYATQPTQALANSPGPVGWIFSIIDVIANLKDTLKSIGDYEDKFIDSLKTAGPALAKQLQKSIFNGTEIVKSASKFVQGFVEGIPDIIQSMAAQVGPLAAALIKGIIIDTPKLIIGLLDAFFSPETWKKAAESFLKGFASGFTQLGKDWDKMTTSKSVTAPKTYGNPFTDAIAASMTGQSHADGARYADRTGYMMVHKGERIDTADQVQRGESGGQRGTGRGRMLGAGGKVYIEIDADSLDDSFGQLGRRGYRLGSA